MEKTFHKLPVRLTTIAFLGAFVASVSGCEPDAQSAASFVQDAPQGGAARPLDFDMGVSAEQSKTFETYSVLFHSSDLLHAEFANTGEIPVRIEFEIHDDNHELVLARNIEVGPGDTSRSTLNVPGSSACHEFDYKVQYTVFYPDVASANSPLANFELQFRPDDPTARSFRGRCEGLNCEGFDFSTNAPIFKVGPRSCKAPRGRCDGPNCEGSDVAAYAPILEIGPKIRKAPRGRCDGPDCEGSDIAAYAPIAPIGPKIRNAPRGRCDGPNCEGSDVSAYAPIFEIGPKIRNAPRSR